VPVIRDGDLLMAESAPIARYVFAKSAMSPTAEQDARTSIFMDQVAGNIIAPWFVCCGCLLLLRRV
jgi:glutathione S-transferase